MTFWEHLEELRACILHTLVVYALATVACFFFKDMLFQAVLYPKPAAMQIINIDIAQQFLTHIKVAALAGLLLAMPFALYQIFAFISPGLYNIERRIAAGAMATSYLLFVAGAAINYFLIFPVTVDFLFYYRVSPDIENRIALTSYINLLFIMSLIMGIAFELPVFCWLLARIGVLKSSFMTRYRRHAIVVILIVSAVITPTGDPFTLMLVALPIWILWEGSIFIVKRTEKKKTIET